MNNRRENLCVEQFMNEKEINNKEKETVSMKKNNLLY